MFTNIRVETAQYGLEIILNRVHLKTNYQSNTSTIEHKTSFTWFETKRSKRSRYLLASISNTSTTGKMSDRAAEVKLTLLEAVVKGYPECSFAVRLGYRFNAKKKLAKTAANCGKS